MRSEFRQIIEKHVYSGLVAFSLTVEQKKIALQPVNVIKIKRCRKSKAVTALMAANNRV